MRSALPFLPILLLAILPVLPGCVPHVVKTQAAVNKAATAEYVKRVEAGQTTREQDLAMLREEARLAAAMAAALGVK